LETSEAKSRISPQQGEELRKLVASQESITYGGLTTLTNMGRLLVKDDTDEGQPTMLHPRELYPHEKEPSVHLRLR
jgi:hypothetical protein